MTGRVIFLNTLYFPDREESEYLLRLQDNLYRANVEFYFATRMLPLSEVKFRKVVAHNHARHKLKVIRKDEELS